jgi:aerobic-type carbon monoxide dehydrogenase small subunit (CoxS/CutS family)
VVATGHRPDGRLGFQCDGSAVDVECEPGESLLNVLRERLGMVSVKDGCAPQGQCGCCTVLVDGEPRVACVTPAERVAGRTVTTLDGLDPALKDRLVDAFVATGASQCGFCTPGILVRSAALLARGKDHRTDVDRALAAHLCRCTGWQTIYEAIDQAVHGYRGPVIHHRDLGRAERRAELEGGVPQRVGVDVPRGDAGFADDTAPRDALVAVPAANGEWVVAETLAEARELAGKVQGRRTTVDERPPLPLPPLPEGGVRLATSWVEPAYLEPDASWCLPGGEPATPLANGGAFGGKAASLASGAARELADRHGRTVRIVYSREDSVRLGPKRPPIAASAVYRYGAVHIDGATVGGASPTMAWPSPYAVEVYATWDAKAVAGPLVGAARAAGIAEQTVLLEAALHEAGVARAKVIGSPRVEEVLLDTVSFGSGDTEALAGARVLLTDTGAIERVEVRVAAGDPLDDVVLRSYCIGAAHMALGWVCSEGLAVDPDTGEVLDLTIRSFGVIRPARTPPIDVTILDDPLPPQPRASDAVFAAVAAATWNAITEHEGARPEVWPARQTAAARALRR